MRVLLPAAIVAQAADTLTFLQLPPGAEMNPLVTGLTPAAAVFLKAGVVMLAIAAAGEEYHLGHPYLGQAILIALIFVGALGFGSNLAVLS